MRSAWPRKAQTSSRSTSAPMSKAFRTRWQAKPTSPRPSGRSRRSADEFWPRWPMFATSPRSKVSSAAESTSSVTSTSSVPTSVSTSHHLHTNSPKASGALSSTSISAGTCENRQGSNPLPDRTGRRGRDHPDQLGGRAQGIRQHRALHSRETRRQRVDENSRAGTGSPPNPSEHRQLPPRSTLR